MKLIQEIKKALWTKYQGNTLFSSDAIPFYLDHVPNSIAYPFIVCYHISSGNYMAMPSVSQVGGFDYVDSRFQLTVFGNDREHVALEDIGDRLEDCFHRQPLSLGNNCTHIATISLNQKTLFYDQMQKIWSLRMDFRILAGK